MFMATSFGMCFLLASYFVLAAFIEDIKTSLKELKENWLANRSQADLMREFSDIVRLHADTIQLSRKNH